jgi:membrane peptidoglycan carboxypeptidase
VGAGVAAAADAVGTVMQDAMSAFEAAVAAAGRPARPQDTTTQSRDTAPQPAGEVWDEATDEPAVRTRPPANGSVTRQAGPRRPSAEPKPPSTGSKQPSAEPRPPSTGSKQPSAEAKPPSAGSKQPSGQAKRTSATAKKPAAGAKKPAARSDGSATDRTPSDGPPAAKPDEPTD